MISTLHPTCAPVHRHQPRIYPIAPRLTGPLIWTAEACYRFSVKLPPSPLHIQANRLECMWLDTVFQCAERTHGFPPPAHDPRIIKKLKHPKVGRTLSVITGVSPVPDNLINSLKFPCGNTIIIFHSLQLPVSHNQPEKMNMLSLPILTIHNQLPNTSTCSQNKKTSRNTPLILRKSTPVKAERHINLSKNSRAINCPLGRLPQGKAPQKLKTQKSRCCYA